MPIKVFYYKASDLISTSKTEQLLFNTDKAFLNEKSSIRTVHCPLYNTDGSDAGTVIWNSYIYQNNDNPSFYNKTGFRTLKLYDGSIITNFSSSQNVLSNGTKYVAKATCATGIYNSINDVFVHFEAFEDLRQLTIFFESS